MVDFLSNLYERIPGILGGEFRAVWTLTMYNYVLDLENLLQDSAREDLDMVILFVLAFEVLWKHGSYLLLNSQLDS